MRLRREIEVDKERYQGLHGTAILSRFPIKSAKLIALKYQPYNWYREEKKRISWPEAVRRKIGQIAFLETTTRQIRIGGRGVLIAELEIAQLPEKTLTIVATQLENRCQPAERRKQMREVLSFIKNVNGPLILAGDLNTSGADLKPTSIRRELIMRVTSKQFWSRQMIKAILPMGLTADLLLDATGTWRSLHDPTSRGIFLLAPNRESHLFDDLERWRFADGYAFDFRGDIERTVNNTRGTLANSNQRSTTKGFTTTHAMERTFWGIGKTRLDWIFVKAYAKEPRNLARSYRMAPCYARTLERLNYSLAGRLSDHNPITVDLPLREPGAQR